MQLTIFVPRSFEVPGQLSHFNQLNHHDHARGHRGGGVRENVCERAREYEYLLLILHHDRARHEYPNQLEKHHHTIFWAPQVVFIE